MYCRNCGNEIFDKTVFCGKCGAKKGGGTNFCQICGAHTSLKMEYCLSCGVKQRTKAMECMDMHRISQLQGHAKRRQKSMKNAKTAAIISIAVVIFLFIILVARPRPDNIPEPYMEDAQVFGVIYDFYNSADYDVQIYWEKGRKLLIYIFLCICVFIGSLLVYARQKKKYKKIMNKIKEAENVLQKLRNSS